MDNEVEYWVSSKEIAEHLGINKDTHRWIKNKSIPLSSTQEGFGNLK